MEIEVTALRVGGERIGTVHHMYRFDPYKYRSTDTLVHDMAYTIAPIPGHGYAGYKSRDWLEQSIRNDIGPEIDTSLAKQNLAAAVFGLESVDVDGIFNEAVGPPFNALPTQRLHLYVFPWMNGEDLNHQFMGYTAGKHILYFYANPGDNFRERVRLAMPHEYGHSSRQEKCPEDTINNLLNWIIHEGIAENFREEVSPKAIPDWIKNTTYKELYEAWKHARSLLDSTDHQVLRNAVDFSGENNGLAYRLGYHIVRWALQRTGQRVKDIIHLSDEEIVRMSGFPL